MQTNVERRMNAGLRPLIERLGKEVPEPNERLRLMGNLLLPLYSYELGAASGDEIEMADARAYQETWDDTLRLQEKGVYPAAFTSVKVPVLMLHGAADPHPGRMIRDSLQPHVLGLEYYEI
jgi:pimeloyl-ACP methyl ester carboxylesterase